MHHLRLEMKTLVLSRFGRRFFLCFLQYLSLLMILCSRLPSIQKRRYVLSLQSPCLIITTTSFSDRYMDGRWCVEHLLQGPRALLDVSMKKRRRTSTSSNRFRCKIHTENYGQTPQRIIITERRGMQHIEGGAKARKANSVHCKFHRPLR